MIYGGSIVTMTDTRDITTETTDDRSITLPYSQSLLNGMFAVALHASKDDMSPIIETVKVDARTFIATDRYTIGQWEHTTLAESNERNGEQGPANPDAHVLVPRTAAEWLAKQSLRTLGFDRYMLETALTVTFAPDHISIQWATDASATSTNGEPQVVAITRFAELKGNYPPVARLLTEESDYVNKDHNAPAMIALGPEHLDKVIKGCKRAGDRNEPIRMWLTKSDYSDKPGPIGISFAKRFLGAIQPNLITR